jgi:1-acyl-sn-glycerol-3-phosphate acyltransferase
MARGFSRPALAAFELVVRPSMRLRVHAVRVAGLPRGLPADLPLLLVANHVSWWDPFLLREVHRGLRPAAPLYSVMLLRELRPRPFLRRVGALGIDPERPASVAHAVRELQRRLRERPDSVVAFYPQGRIWPSHRRPLGFQRGVELFLRHLRPLIVLPVALHLEPLAARAPTAFVHVGEPILPGEGPADAGRLEAEVEARLDELHAFLAARGEEAPGAWPAPDGSLPARAAATR